MEIAEIINIFSRWAHVLFGVTWIGLLYYFNFVQGDYFKEASPEGLSDAKAKLAPRALAWFRWAAMMTFITGVALLHAITTNHQMNPYITLGATMGTIMFLNVWLIIWPNQKVVLGMKEGDGAAAGAKALLASRTNTLLSGPMLFGMLAGPHYASSGGGYGAVLQSNALWLGLAVIALIELNALFGKLGPIASVKGVIHSSVILTIAFGFLFTLA